VTPLFIGWRKEIDEKTYDYAMVSSFFVSNTKTCRWPNTIFIGAYDLNGDLHRDAVSTSTQLDAFVVTA
jgi:hypothetical protein